MKLIQETVGKTIVYHLIGNIDETADFSIFPQGIKELHLDCYEVSRINSVGVKHWIDFFASLTAQGVQWYLYRASSAIVEQINVIQNFSDGGTVVSVVLNFHCAKCGHSGLIEKSRAAIQALGVVKFTLDCPACKQHTFQFDDDPKEYFEFWK